MMRSLFAGVSGLKTHQTRMDVIGNNIANVNTVAYKSSSMTFASLMSQTTQKASGANSTTGTGGVNPRQIGLGVKTSAINVNVTGQGASQSTGNPLDIMITGENFFIVNDGRENYFTRDGSFYVDGAGNLAMTSIGYNVMGWQVDETTGAIKKDSVSALRIMNTANLNYPPEATTQGYMSGILDKNDTDVTSPNGKVVNFTFFDSLGYSYNAKFVFKQSDSEAKNVYSLELDNIYDSSTGEPIDLNAPNGVVFGGRSKQTLAGKVSRTKGYQWNGTTLMNTNVEPNQAVADLKNLVAGNELKARNARYDETSETDTRTVQDVLEEIAKVYGYEDVDNFLNLMVTETVPATGVDGTETKNDFSIQAMLLAAAGATLDPAPANNLTTLGVSGDGKEQEFDTTGRYFTGVTVEYDEENGTFKSIDGVSDGENRGIISLNLRGAGVGTGNFENIRIDISATTNVNNNKASTIGATNGADDEYSTGSGRRNGAMSGISVQQNGMIYASYDNGMTKLLGQIATAKFANASGLEKLADNLYGSTLNSGSFDGVGVDITADGNYMSTGQLEMSNVDLSSEFTEMITTQRGFQANSRIITVSDTLLEELTNLKR